jgi:hypothetical protein
MAPKKIIIEKVNIDSIIPIDNKQQIQENKIKKKQIPKALKISVWHKYIGETIGKSKCMCCNITDITQMKFHAGHIISEYNGGEMHIDNLKPICESCNKSMGIKNMSEFINILNSSTILENEINSIYNNIKTDIKKLYENINEKEFKKKLLTQQMLPINEKDRVLSGNIQYDINKLFYNKLETMEINNKKMIPEKFKEQINEIKSTFMPIKISIYKYLENLNENEFLAFIYTYYKK